MLISSRTDDAVTVRGVRISIISHTNSLSSLTVFNHSLNITTRIQIRSNTGTSLEFHDTETSSQIYQEQVEEITQRLRHESECRYQG